MIMRWENKRWVGRWREIEGSPVFWCAQFMSHFTFKRSRCTSYNVQQLKLQRLCWERLLNILEDRQRIRQLGIKITSSQIKHAPAYCFRSLKCANESTSECFYSYLPCLRNAVWLYIFFSGNFLGIQTFHTVLCEWRHISVEKALEKSVTHALSVGSRIFWKVNRNVYSVKQKGLSDTFFHSFTRIIQRRNFRYDEMIC